MSDIRGLEFPHGSPADAQLNERGLPMARELKLLRDIESLVAQRHVAKSALADIFGIDVDYCDSCHGRQINEATQIAARALNALDDMRRDSDGSSEAGETPKSGSTQRATARASQEASPEHSSSHHPRDPDK